MRVLRRRFACEWPSRTQQLLSLKRHPFRPQKLLSLLRHPFWPRQLLSLSRQVHVLPLPGPLAKNPDDIAKELFDTLGKPKAKSKAKTKAKSTVGKANSKGKGKEAGNLSVKLSHFAELIQRSYVI